MLIYGDGGDQIVSAIVASTVVCIGMDVWQQISTTSYLLELDNVMNCNCSGYYQDLRARFATLPTVDDGTDHDGT